MILGTSPKMAPSKPTKLGFDGFAGSLSTASAKTCAFGFQSIHWLRLAGFAMVVVLIPILSDSPRSVWMDAHHAIPIHRPPPSPIRHPLGLLMPPRHFQEYPIRS